MSAMLPLYPVIPRLPIEDGDALPRNPACERCELNTGKVQTPCMTTEVQVDGQTGGLLVVYPSPTYEEDSIGRPFSSQAAVPMRKEISKHWSGHVAFAPAARCAAGSNLAEVHVDACRPYLRSAIEDIKPERIICFGPMAAYAVLGRKLRAFDSRRAYAYTSDGIPVFVLFHPLDGLLNRFVGRWLRRDLEWALTKTPPKPPLTKSYELISSVADAQRALAKMRTARFVVNDVETMGVMWERDFKIVCASMTTDDLTSFVWTEEALNDPAVTAPLVEALESEDIPVGGQNFKYDCNSWAADMRPWVRCRVRGIYGDTLLWRKIFESDAAADLDTMAELVGMGGAKAENKAALKLAQDKVKNARAQAAKGFTLVPGLVDEALEWSVKYIDHPVGNFAYGLVERDVLYRYCARDTVVTTCLMLLYEARIAGSEAAGRVWNVLLKPATHALARVQEWGMAADPRAIRAFSDYLAVHLEQLMRRMMQWGEFNPTSSTDVARHLFQALRLPVVKLTAGKTPSTDKHALRALHKHHPLIPLLEEFRMVSTMKNRYADGMVVFVRGDRRIHGRLLLDGTRAGRLSMRDPNLQNIPSRGPLAKMAKDIFIAPPGRAIVQLDYSQIEYRVAAMLSQDPVFMQVFTDGHDLHQRTAELISMVAWGIPPDQVTKEHRAAAKTVNFGLFYGMGDESLAALLGCSVMQAKKIREAVLGQFKVTAQWIEEQIRYCQQHGVTWTYWDGKRARMRQLWNIASSDGAVASRAKNGSFNTPVQGSAADYTLKSLCEIVDWIEGDNIDAKVVNTVHDSIIIECNESEIDDVVDAARAIMEQWPSGGVPLVADAEIGWSWGSLVGYEEALEVVDMRRIGTDVATIVDHFKNDKGEETITAMQVDRIAAAWKVAA